MRLEMTRTFPVPRQRGWDYVEDFHTWPEWMDADLVDPDESARAKPGDTVRLRTTLLGVPMHGSLILEEMVSPEMSRTLYRWPGWPDIHVEQRYSHAGPSAFTMELIASSDEDEGWLGTAIAWLMVNTPLMMRQQIHEQFDRLDEAFRKGYASTRRTTTKKAA
ncbi:MAG: hypothetical protein QNJ71_02620 [Acidimicrobiia bacterium]|nr:hypothetical protein [Acidimicrobiia bacterium]